MELKSLPPNVKEFKANGQDYVVSSSISPERYKEYEKTVPEMTYGLNWYEVHKNLLKAYDLINKMQFLDAGIAVHNILNGIKEVDNPTRVHPSLWMCALVINRKDEDPGPLNKTLMTEKIADWQAEGLDMMSFFGLARNSIQGFNQTLLAFTQASLKEISEEINKA